MYCFTYFVIQFNAESDIFPFVDKEVVIQSM